MNKGIELSEKVTLYEDGKYRWLYELNMYKNPSIFYTVAKVVGISAFLPLAVLLFVTMREGHSLSQIMKEMIPVYIVIALMIPITGFSYWFVAHRYDGVYCMVYEMDENGVEFRQIDKQFEKQKVIAKLAAFTGALTGNLGLLGSALYNMTAQSAYSDFNKVYSVRSFKERNLIKVNSPFLFNQVYAQDEDFDFVENFIRDHCPRVR